MKIIRRKTRNSSVYFTYALKSCNSLHRFGKHDQVNHDKRFATKRAHINTTLMDYGHSPTHKLYNYRGVSRSNFLLYLKEMGWLYNYRRESTMQLLIHIYFGYVSK